jgi:hypothetical protein
VSNADKSMANIKLTTLMRQLVDVTTLHHQLLPRYGVTWFRYYLLAFVLIAAISGFFSRSLNATLMTLSVCSMLFIVLWWLMFVSTMVSIARTDLLKLTPNYWRAMTLLVVVVWLAAGLILTTFVMSFAWSFVLVLLLMFATSLSNRKEREVATLLITVITVLILIFAYINNDLFFFSRRYTFFDHAEILVAFWAIDASILGLIGLTRVMPMLGLVVWAVWLGAMQFSQPLFGLSFDDLLQFIYGVTSQMLTHLITAIGLFGLMLYGLVGKPGMVYSRKPSALSNFSFRFTNAVAYLGLSKKRGWQLLPGYNYYLQHALARPQLQKDFFSLSLGPQVHWTTVAWVGLFLTVVAGYWLGYMFRLDNNYYDVRSNSTPISRYDNSVSLIWYLLLLLPASFVPIFMKRLWQCRFEHQLLRLTPAWSGIDLTTALSKNIIQFSVQLFCVNFVILVVWALMINLPAAYFLSVLWAPIVFVVSIQFAGLIVLFRDYDLMRSEKHGWEIYGVGLMWLPLIAVIIQNLAKLKDIGLIFIPETVCFGLCIAAFYRYKVFIAKPSALPAGINAY